MKHILTLSLIVVVIGQNNAMVPKHKSKKLVTLEQDLNTQFRKFQDIQNEMYRLSLENKSEELKKLQNETTKCSENVIEIIFGYDNGTIKYISTSIRNRIIALLHQSDSERKSYLALHEQMLKTLTNKIPDADFADWAVEYDLTCSQNSEPQRYGTLVDCNHQVELPVAGCPQELSEHDYKRINNRRKSVGLPLLHYSLSKKNAPAPING